MQMVQFLRLFSFLRFSISSSPLFSFFLVHNRSQYPMYFLPPPRTFSGLYSIQTAPTETQFLPATRYWRFLFLFCHCCSSCLYADWLNFNNTINRIDKFSIYARHWRSTFSFVENFFQSLCDYMPNIIASRIRLRIVRHAR